ncbi:MAG TPA: hypothetical protein VH682_04845 [Gemmataceae bacterium]
MRGTFILSLACGAFILLCQSGVHRTAQAQETTRIAPASNGVELEQIRIVRWTALDAAKNADLTNMELGLWFSAAWKRKGNQFAHLIRFQSLSAIEDDSGRLLSTEKRRKQIEYLRGEVRGDTWKSSGGKEGPVIRLLLEAPARGAGKIKAVKGTAEVSMAKTVSLTFNDLAAFNGKELDHPDMKSLRTLKLRFSIEEKDGKVTAKVTAPVNYASPWNRGRLQEWALTDGGRVIGIASEGVSPEGESVAVEKTYRRRTFKGLSLRLRVLEPVESKTFKFNFQNIELP